MLKTLFTLLVGTFFAASTLLLIGIYWLIGALARLVSFLAMPLRWLFSKH